MATNGPIPVLLLPDGVLTGRANVVSVTSEANPYTAPAVAGEDNYGDLVPSFTTPALSIDYAYDVKIQRAGGVYAQSEWIWKNQSDGGTLYRGVDEVRYLDKPHDPFYAIGSLHPAGAATAVTSAVYASRIGKIFLYMAGLSDTVYVASRVVGADATTWIQTTITFSTTGYLKTGAARGIEVLEMPDGSLRMLLVSGTNATTDNDVSVFGSQDGLTWTLLARNVFSKAYGATANILRMRAAVSGDWVRLLILDNASVTLRTFVSSDRCATFTYLENSDLTGAGVGVETNGNAIDPYGAFDIEGVGDATGSFILVLRTSTSSISAEFRTAGRDADWSESSNLTNATGAILSVALVQDGARLYVMFSGIIAGFMSINGMFIELDRAIEGGNYAFGNFFLNWQEYVQYSPAYMVGVKADPGFALLFGLTNPDSGPGNAVANSCGMVYGRQWSTRSLWKHEDERIAAANALIGDRWDSIVGPPNKAGSATTPFASHFGASSSETWVADRLGFESTTLGVNGRRYYALNEGAAGTWASEADAYFGWTIGALSTTLNGTSDDRVAVRLRALATSALVTYDLSVRHSATQIVCYDNNASVALATLTADLASKFYSVRLALGVSGTTRAELSASPVNSIGLATWSSALMTPTSAVGATFQGFEWGHLTGVANQSSYWRRIEFDDGSACNQFGFSNSVDQRGAPCVALPMYVTNNVYASWSGGAGFEDDSWTAEPRHTNEVDNLFLPSPRSYWSGTSLATQHIVLTADADDTSARFDHSGIAVFGTSTHRMTVAYESSDSWGSPIYSAAVTNDMTPALRVSAAVGHYVDVAGLTLDGGEYVGKYARTVVAGDSVISFRIARQAGQRLYLEQTGAILAGLAFPAGSSLWIHDDKFVVQHPARQQYAFMRLTFPCPTGTTPATLDIRAGTLIAGPTMDFPAAINWAHTTTEAPNVEMSEGVQGLRWGYEMGPSRRAFEGRIVGDVNRNRRVLANQLRNLSQFSARPLVFATDSDDLLRSSMLVRYMGAVENQNAGWKQRDDGSWYPIGDLTIAFDEEV
jgi:hypothetical protein